VKETIVTTPLWRTSIINNQSGSKQFFMAKTIKSKVEYQVTELVNNLNEAATAQSEQKRDFFTTKALYNAKRLSTFVSKAKIGAMAIAITLGMVACGNPASTEATATDSTKVDSSAVAVDTTAAVSADTTSIVK
jgi:hypothetical protein